MAAVRHLGYPKQAYMDYSTRCRTPFSTHVPIWWRCLDRRRGRVMSILLFYLLGAILTSFLCQWISELGGPNPTRLVPWGTPAIGPWQVFLDFWKILLVRNGCAPKTNCIEIWVKICFFCPIVKIGEGGRIFVDFYGRVPWPPPMVWKQWRPSGRSPSVSSGGKKRHEQKHKA